MSPVKRSEHELVAKLNAHAAAAPGLQEQFRAEATAAAAAAAAASSGVAQLGAAVLSRAARSCAAMAPSHGSALLGDAAMRQSSRAASQSSRPSSSCGSVCRSACSPAYASSMACARSRATAPCSLMRGELESRLPASDGELGAGAQHGSSSDTDSETSSLVVAMHQRLRSRR